MSRPTWNEERMRKAARLLAAGASCAQVAKALGVARGSVCWASRQYGLRPRGAHVPAEPRLRKPGRDEWDESRLTERWADRRAR
jgi:transposase